MVLSGKCSWWCVEEKLNKKNNTSSAAFERVLFSFMALYVLFYRNHFMGTRLAVSITCGGQRCIVSFFYVRDNIWFMIYFGRIKIKLMFGSLFYKNEFR